VAADDWRSALTNPMGYVLTAVRAQLDGDEASITEIFDLIERAGLWQITLVVALAELGEALKELHGDAAQAWLAERLRHGLDPEPGIS
jgi:hypothetical protein